MSLRGSMGFSSVVRRFLFWYSPVWGGGDAGGGLPQEGIYYPQKYYPAKYYPNKYFP